MTSTQQRCFLIRHGETEWSRDRRHTGRTDLPLLPEAEHQLEAVRRLLDGSRLEAVFTSPLTRARQTSRYLDLGVTEIVDVDLVEWDYGEYEGLTTEEIRRERPGWDLFEDGAPGGETLAEVCLPGRPGHRPGSGRPRRRGLHRPCPPAAGVGRPVAGPRRRWRPLLRARRRLGERARLGARAARSSSPGTSGDEVAEASVSMVLDQWCSSQWCSSRWCSSRADGWRSTGRVGTSVSAPDPRRGPVQRAGGALSDHARA